MNQLTENIKKDVKSKMERTKCPEHKESPKVTFTPTGFTVSCCCEEFRETTIAKCKQAIGEAIQKEIMKPLKKLR